VKTNFTSSRGGAGRPDVENSNRWKQASENTPAAGDGRSGKVRNKPVRFQKRLRAADYIPLLFCTEEYHKPYSGCNQNIKSHSQVFTKFL